METEGKTPRAQNEITPAKALEAIYRYTVYGEFFDKCLTGVLALEKEKGEKPAVANYLQAVAPEIGENLIEEIAVNVVTLGEVPDDKPTEGLLQMELQAARVLRLDQNKFYKSLELGKEGLTLDSLYAKYLPELSEATGADVAVTPRPTQPLVPDPARVQPVTGEERRLSDQQKITLSIEEQKDIGPPIPEVVAGIEKEYEIAKAQKPISETGEEQSERSNVKLSETEQLKAMGRFRLFLQEQRLASKTLDTSAGSLIVERLRELRRFLDNNNWDKLKSGLRSQSESDARFAEIGPHLEMKTTGPSISEVLEKIEKEYQAAEAGEATGKPEEPAATEPKKSGLEILSDPGKRKEVEEIIREVRELIKSSGNALILDTWNLNFYPESLILQKRLSSVLNLQGDEGIQAQVVLIEEERSVSGIILLNLLEGSQHRRNYAQTAELLRKMYSQATDQVALQQVLDSTIKNFEASSFKTSNDLGLIQEFDSLERQAAGAKDLRYSAIDNNYIIASDHLTNLISGKEQGSLEDLIKAYIERNKTYATFERSYIDQIRLISDFERGLAEKAGIKIKYIGEYGDAVLEEINPAGETETQIDSEVVSDVSVVQPKSSQDKQDDFIDSLTNIPPDVREKLKREKAEQQAKIQERIDALNNQPQYSGYVAGSYVASGQGLESVSPSDIFVIQQWQDGGNTVYIKSRPKEASPSAGQVKMLSSSIQAQQTNFKLLDPSEQSRIRLEFSSSGGRAESQFKAYLLNEELKVEFEKFEKLK